jgi:hypothetical protein
MSDFRHPPAFELATQWCENNVGWTRFCDMSSEDSERLTLKFNEIDAKSRQYWRKKYGRDAERAWREFSSVNPTRWRTGYMSDDGRFHDNILTACRDASGNVQNVMMVVHITGEQARWHDGRKT